MNILEFFIFIIKVILLLAVILIFSYVNTKKSHIAKVEKLKNEKLKKKEIKEGNEVKLTKDDEKIYELVNKSKGIINYQKKQDDANISLLENSINTINRNDFITEKKVIEGFGQDDDKAAQDSLSSLESNQDEMANQVCKYEGSTLAHYIYLFFYYILFIFIWLAKAIYNLFDEETKNKPKTYFGLLFSPFSWIFFFLKIAMDKLLILVAFLKEILFVILGMFGNILFVFAPSSIIEILSYILSPLLAGFRGLPSGFNPFGSICWKK